MHRLSAGIKVKGEQAVAHLSVCHTTCPMQHTLVTLVMQRKTACKANTGATLYLKSPPKVHERRCITVCVASTFRVNVSVLFPSHAAWRGKPFRGN